MATALPSQELTIQDPGMGLAPSTDAAPVFVGGCTSGTANTVYSFGRISDVVETLGQGPLVEDVCFALQKAGGPIVAIKSATSVSASNTAVTPTRIGTSTGTITVAGTAADSYAVKVKIIASGTLGAGTFQYSLDGGRTYSPTITIPSGGTYALASTGLTLTFVPGAGAAYYDVGDVHAFSTTAASFNATDLSSVITALKTDGRLFPFIALCGDFGAAASGALVGAAFDTHLESFATLYKYVAGIMGAGFTTDAAGTASAWSSVTTKRYMRSYGKVWVASAKPLMGMGYVRKPVATVLAVRAMTELISTHLGRVKSGPISGIAPNSDEFGAAVDHDEYNSEGMDANGFATLRTWPGRKGWYITRGRIAAPVGSDFTDWHYRRCMDVACTVTQQTLLEYVNSTAIANADGTIAEGDARRIEGDTDAQLSIALLEPKNAEGNKGHVSAASAAVDRTNNALQSKTLQAQVSVRSLAYLEKQKILIGYVAAARTA
jgi:hypothetical protein